MNPTSASSYQASVDVEKAGFGDSKFDYSEQDYRYAEKQFTQLLETENLDHALQTGTVDSSFVDGAVTDAIETVYLNGEPAPAAHRFLQRILYFINRLKLFWYDDLQHYTNERSHYLIMLRDRIELAWQQWENSQLNLDSYRNLDIKQALLQRAELDVDPPLSHEAKFFREQVGLAGYRELVAIGALDGLVEASQLSRTLGGVANDVHAVLTRLLVEEYGAGRLPRKHSSYYLTMLEELGMQTEPEAYLDAVPWEVLATINHSFLLTERKRYFLRYIGGLFYIELTVPAAFSSYQVAAERLGLSDAAMTYWKLHIKVDELHGKWMLNDATLPLVDQYPVDAWELLWGYDQQKYMGDRAGAAVARAAYQADERG
ncbi:iron-containing redox enzyme family protein [Leptolyngbya sp. AN02str]|uniref:iron-containing redox enzyme family protein n=1 Tax=Leptolyngbya sp. AN02str TaxID=3423363 RepID=UPI003D311943